MKILLFLGFALLLTGCGTSIGEGCTTSDDCGGQICINRGGRTPGGYCSKQCVLGDDSNCGGGAICVKEGAGKDFHACFLSCERSEDCRKGYSCLNEKDGQRKVCVGPEGF